MCADLAWHAVVLHVFRTAAKYQRNLCSTSSTNANMAWTYAPKAAPLNVKCSTEASLQNQLEKQQQNKHIKTSKMSIGSRNLYPTSSTNVNMAWIYAPKPAPQNVKCNTAASTAKPELTSQNQHRQCQMPMEPSLQSQLEKQKTTQQQPK